MKSERPVFENNDLNILVSYIESRFDAIEHRLTAVADEVGEVLEILEHRKEVAINDRKKLILLEKRMDALESK